MTKRLSGLSVRASNIVLRSKSYTGESRWPIYRKNGTYHARRKAYLEARYHYLDHLWIANHFLYLLRTGQARNLLHCGEKTYQELCRHFEILPARIDHTLRDRTAERIREKVLFLERLGYTVRAPDGASG
jgi:hypothetical protein